MKYPEVGEFILGSDNAVTKPWESHNFLYITKIAVSFWFLMLGQANWKIKVASYFTPYSH